MSALRKAAVSLFQLLCTTLHGDEWARAMRDELPYIDDDRAAFTWAIGSAAALLEVRARRTIAQSGADLLYGVTLAIAAGAIGLGTTALLFTYDRAFAEQTRWLPGAVFMAMPCALFVFGGAAFWRRRRAVAIGVIACGLLLAAHFALRLAAQGYV